MLILFRVRLSHEKNPKRRVTRPLKLGELTVDILMKPASVPTFALELKNIYIRRIR
jgi:hypothetical protein